MVLIRRSSDRGDDVLNGAGALGDPRFTLGELPMPMVFAGYRIIRDCNEEFIELFGFERGEIVGESFARLYPKLDDFIRIGEIWQGQFSRNAIYRDERIMRDAGGRPVLVPGGGAHAHARGTRSQRPSIAFRQYRVGTHLENPPQ